MILRDIIGIIEKGLVLKAQESWDNSGLQVGSPDSGISKVMLTLDLDRQELDSAVKNGVDLIITHHPFIFGSIKSIDFNTYEGEIIRELIINNINLYSMHTSLDMADFGVNHELASKLGIKEYDVLHVIDEGDGSGYGGIGDIFPINITEYAADVKNALNCSSVRLFCNDGKQAVKRVAFCGGSGSDFIKDAIAKKADVYITGDIKYHQAQEALKKNLCIIDAGHYYTEYHSLAAIKNVLEGSEASKNLNIILSEKNTVNEIVI